MLNLCLHRVTPFLDYICKKRWKFDILDLLVIIKDVLVLIRQLMDTILKVNPLSFHVMYHSLVTLSIVNMAPQTSFRTRHNRLFHKK